MAQEIIYGAYHGQEYPSQHYNDDGVPVGEPVTKVIHDPRMEVSWTGGGHDQFLQIGIVHPNEDGDYEAARYDDSTGLSEREQTLQAAFREFWRPAESFQPPDSVQHEHDWRMFVAGADAERAATRSFARAVYMQVSRSAANRIVKAVRLGRDKTFGKDE